MDTLNPGVRRVVALLRAWAFVPCDSGDGVTHDHPCDRAYPYVVCRVQADSLVRETRRLVEELSALGVTVVSQTAAWDGDTLRGVCVQASFDPVEDLATLDVMGLHDGLLRDSQLAPKTT